MARQVNKPNARVRQIFEDLENFLEFCREYGYRYNESDLYNWKSYAFQQYNKYTQGKNAKDMWIQDQPRFDRRS